MMLRPFVAPELEEAILARRRQIRCGSNDAAMDNDRQDHQHDSFSATSNGHGGSVTRSSRSHGDGTGSAAMAKRRAREASIHNAVMALSSAVHELDSLGSGSQAAPVGVFDFLRGAKGGVRLTLEEFGPAPDQEFSASDLASTPLSATLRLKRKQQQLKGAASCLRARTEVLATQTAANQASSRMVQGVAKHWRMVIPSLGAGGRLLSASTDALAVDCSLASAGGAAAAAWNLVPLEVCPLSGAVSCAPRLAVEQCLLVLKLEDSSGAASRVSMEECSVVAALGPSLQNHIGVKLGGASPSSSSSLEASLAEVQASTLSRELMFAMRTEALAASDSRWLPKGGTNPSPLSVLAVSESTISVELSKGVTLTAQLCAPATAARATSSNGLAAKLLRRSVQLLLDSWRDSDQQTGSDSKPVPVGQESKKPVANKRVKKTASGADFAVVKTDRLGSVHKEKEKSLPSARVVPLLATLAESSRHARLLASLHQASSTLSQDGWTIEEVGASHWADVRSKHRLSSPDGRALFVTVNGATGCLDLDVSGWAPDWAHHLTISMGVGECMEFCQKLL